MDLLIMSLRYQKSDVSYLILKMFFEPVRGKLRDFASVSIDAIKVENEACPEGFY
jgi:hypothetical protein